MPKFPSRLTLLIILVGTALVTYEAGAKERPTFKVSPELVKQVCGDQLATGGGSFGCNKCSTQSKTCTDYNCSDGSNNTKKGCYRTPLRTATPTKPGLGNDLTVKQSSKNVTSKTTTGAAAAAGPPKAGLLTDSATTSSKPTSKAGTKGQTIPTTTTTTTTVR
jgi:hypothetical protein